MRVAPWILLVFSGHHGNTVIDSDLISIVCVVMCLFVLLKISLGENKGREGGLGGNHRKRAILHLGLS